MKILNFQTKNNKTILIYILLLFFGFNQIEAQINAGSNDAEDYYTNDQSWSWTLDDNNNQAPGFMRWWTDGGNNIDQLLMEYSVGDRMFKTFGGFKVVGNANHLWDNLHIKVGGWGSYIESNGDENGMFISSKTGNKITIGDGDDHVVINGGFRIKFNTVLEQSLGIGTEHPKAKLSVNGGLMIVPESLDDLGNTIEGTIFYNKNLFNNNLGNGMVIIKDQGIIYNVIDTENMSKIDAKFNSFRLANLEKGSFPMEYRQDEISGTHLNGEGVIYYDRNFYEPGEAGEGFYEKDGGGLVLKNGDDGWSAVVDTKNMDNLNAIFNNVTTKKTYGFESNSVRLGNNAGDHIDSTNSHVFIGNEAGNKESFDEIAIIDYKDKSNTNPITGNEYLQNNSVFVLNNHGDLKKPLLFGNFAKHGEVNSMAQLAINTHHIIDSVALTVSGAVHIGPKNIDPKIFPSKEGYEDALLWVERGVVTENVTYAFVSDWDEWPDYVFAEEYDLMKLSELEKYIKREKHLPGIISRKEVRRKGLKSKGFIKNLLLKIEELTLYIISQEKKIESQKLLNENLLKRLIAIEEKLKN